MWENKRNETKWNLMLLFESNRIESNLTLYLFYKMIDRSIDQYIFIIYFDRSRCRLLIAIRYCVNRIELLMMRFLVSCIIIIIIINVEKIVKTNFQKSYLFIYPIFNNIYTIWKNFFFLYLLFNWLIISKWDK